METGARRVRPVMAATPAERVSSGQPPEPAVPGKAAARKQRSLDEVFGDVLPDSTRDEREDRPDSRTDADYLRDVPPHHT